MSFRQGLRWDFYTRIVWWKHPIRWWRFRKYRKPVQMRVSAYDTRTNTVVFEVTPQ